jgi:hypothetical protein
MLRPPSQRHSLRSRYIAKILNRRFLARFNWQKRMKKRLNLIFIVSLLDLKNAGSITNSESSLKSFHSVTKPAFHTPGLMHLEYLISVFT